MLRLRVETLENVEKKHLIIRGPPRSGKTTIIRKIIAQSPVPLKGFYTVEIRDNNKRIGFDAVCISTKKRVELARVTKEGGNPKIGKYSVFVDLFENFFQECLLNQKITQNDVLIIDEIGKMEALSQLFVDSLNFFFDSVIVLATAPSYNLPVLNEILSRNDVETLWLTVEKRSIVLSDVEKWLKKKLETKKRQNVFDNHLKYFKE